MNAPPPSRHRIQSVGRALQLHDAIAKTPGQRARELAQITSMPDKTLRDYLATLVDAEWIICDGHQYFVNPERRITDEDLRALGTVTATLGAHDTAMTVGDLIQATRLAPTRTRGALVAGVHAGLLARDEQGRYSTTSPRRRMNPRVDELLAEFADLTGHDAALATLYQGRLVLTHLHKPAGQVSLLDGVTTDAAHATSAGHSLLHQLLPHQLRAFVEEGGGMRRFTSRTPTTLEQLELLLSPDLAGIYVAEGQYAYEGACLALGLRSGAPDGRCVAFTTSVYIRELPGKRKELQGDLFRTAALLAPIVGPVPLNEIRAGIDRMEAAGVRSYRSDTPRPI